MIKRIRTEVVHLYEEDGTYHGEHIVLNNHKGRVTLIVDMTGFRNDVLVFSKRTGKLLEPDKYKGFYIRNTPSPLKEDYEEFYGTD